MKPVDQTILHDPVNGRYGNCMQAMIASLLEVPIEAVPHFFYDGCNGETFNRRINDWLRPMNLGYLSLAVPDGYYASLGIVGVHHEAAGMSARGVLHACAALDGKVTHDPHPTKTGINSIEEHGVFIVLDPSKPIGHPALGLREAA